MATQYAGEMATNAVSGDMTHHNAAEYRVDASSVQDHTLEVYSEKPPPPPKRRFYRQKKYWIVCSIITVIVVLLVVLLVIFVAFPKIAQSVVNKSKIGLDGADISFTPPDDTLTKRDVFDLNSTFFMSMATKLSNTGPFSATLKFHNPVDVYYNETLLGAVTLPESKVSGGHGSLITTAAPFLIANTTYFAAFAQDMLAKETFVWQLKGKVDIHALSRTATVDLNKAITIPGMNGFPEVSIQSFGLPGDDPNGGILMDLGCKLVSPSPISVELGTITLGISYDGVDLGVVTSEGVILNQGENNLSLKGTLKPQVDPAALEKISVLFSNYVGGVKSQTTALGLTAAPNGKDHVEWLSQGFQSVRLNVLLGVDQPIDIIKTVNLGYLDLAFSKDAPYAPVVNAPSVVAGYSMPFGFSLDIYEVAQTIQMGTGDNVTFASIEVPFSASKTNPSEGVLQFAMTNSTLNGLAGKESTFNEYTYALTASDVYSFLVGGQATTKVTTPIGNVTLQGIKFGVPTNLHGLRFLNSTATVINSLDVTGGTPEYMQLTINVTMENPSDFNISTGDVYFNMQSGDTVLGLVSIPSLQLNRGANTIIAGANFNPKSSDVGQTILSTFVMGQNNSVGIVGSSGSTEIASLAGALGAITLDTILPGLTTPLIQGSSLTVLDTSVATGYVNVKVSIANPFTTSLSITSVVSSVIYKGMPIGNINQDISATPFVVPGHATAESSPLNMAMNMEPASIAYLLRDLAVTANLDTQALDALLTLGGFQIEGQQTVAASSDIFTNFNISNFVMEAMKSLVVDLQLQSGLTIGEYANTLQFSQSGVPTIADESVTLLIPVVGQPIVQQIVDGAVLDFQTIVLSEPTNSAFKVQMKGSLSQTGPMDATISFPAPLSVYWQGSEIGKVTMGNIQVAANVGAQFDLTGDFAVSNPEAMGNFAAYMINNNDFIWEIDSSAVSVSALGYTFSNLKMQKFVTLKGAQGFKDCVTITNFTLPGDDPERGIQLIADTVIQNPSQIGFSLSGASFENYFNGVDLGPLASNGAAVFPPLGTANIQMKGFLSPQTTPEGITAVTTVFGTYIAGNDTILTVKGISGSGPSGEVSWLSTGFKAITIENVVLPGPDTKLDLIPAVTMKNVQFDFTKGAYNPMASSTLVEAQLHSPFGFALGVHTLNMDVTVSSSGVNIAHLQVPDNSATTSPTGVVSTQFAGVPFDVYDDAHPYFDAFVKALTEGPNVAFNLGGIANSVAKTSVGEIPLRGIPFAVSTSLDGFNNFGGKNEILSLAVTGGTPDYIEVSLQVQFTNPSQISITIGDFNLGVILTPYGVSIGTVFLKDVTIVPGPNVFNAVMHMQNSEHPEIIAAVVGSYVSGGQAPLTIVGTETSTEIASLKNGLSTVKLETLMTGINGNLVERTAVKAGAAVIGTKKATTDVTLNNPLGADYAILSVSAYIVNENNGSAYPLGQINYDLPEPLIVPAGGQVVAEAWPVDVLASTIQLLQLLKYKSIQIDIQQNVTVLVGGENGYQTTFMYAQNNVTCDMKISLFGAMSLPINGTEEVPLAEGSSVIQDTATAPLPTTVEESQPTIVASASEEPATTAAPVAETPAAETPVAQAPAASENPLVLPF